MTALSPIREAEASRLPTPELTGGIIRMLTCGSVDDGKSTLIGRLLWDASHIYDDQREKLKRGRRIGDGGHPDYSLLVDGLVAEREQGITIDIAWIYVDTAQRRLVIIDSPGHEQYTRNMASGASHADVAIMLVDARHGVKRQTRRHAAILDLVGVKSVILAVNKMDLAQWSEQTFRAIEADFAKLTAGFGFTSAIAIPVSALAGDNIATPSEAMPWYGGPTLLAYLDQHPARDQTPSGPFRFPVQTVLRDGRDFRGLAGTVSGGRVRVGDEVVDTVSRSRARVARISTMGGDLEIAVQGQAVAIELDRDLDISRGAVLSALGSAPVRAQSIEAQLVWLADTPLDTDYGYLLRTATDLIPVSGLEIKARLDVETMMPHTVGTCEANDIVIAGIGLGRPAALDLFTNARETGSFVLVDSVTGATVAGGVVLSAAEGEGESAGGRFVLTRAMLAQGLNSDLGADPRDDAEFKRRANEVALILGAAGVKVLLADVDASPEVISTTEFGAVGLL